MTFKDPEDHQSSTGSCEPYELTRNSVSNLHPCLLKILEVQGKSAFIGKRRTYTVDRFHWI